MAQYQVIDDLDIQQLAGLYDGPGERYVVGTDFLTAAGVVMSQQDGGRVASDGRLEELAHPHQS